MPDRPRAATRNTRKNSTPEIETDHVTYSGTFESIEALATDCRARLERIVGQSITALGAYRFLRLAVVRLAGQIEDQPDFASGLGIGGSMIVGPGAKNFTIFLPRNSTPAQSTFTVAHELGHLLMHYPLAQPLPRVVAYARFGEGEEERQANRFAGAFLMPRADFKRVWEHHNGDPLLTAVHFGVMPVDAELRAESLRS